MLNTYKAILILLKSFISNEPPVLPGDLNYSELYSIAKDQHIDGILGFVLSNNKLVADELTANNLFNSYISSITVNTNQTHQFQELAKHLIQNQIDIVVFKGYALRNIYPVPELRSFSDVDVLIKEHDREKSHNLMLDLGYDCQIEYGKVYNYKKGIEYYEFHTSLISTDILENSNIVRYFENAWEHTQKNDLGIYEFDNEFHLIYLITHIAKHIYCGGAGIRMYLDIALFIQNNKDFDYNHFIKTTEELNLDKFSCTVINAACSWFSIDLPVYFKNKYETDSETLENLYIFTIDKGLFGNAMDSSGEATVQLMKKKGSKHPKTEALLSIAFPPLKTMKLKHKYLNKYPVLLPVAWVHRAFSHLGNLKSKNKKIKDIISADNDIINKHQQLLKNIGL